MVYDLGIKDLQGALQDVYYKLELQIRYVSHGLGMKAQDISACRYAEKGVLPSFQNGG